MNQIVERIRRAAEVTLACRIHVLGRAEWEASVREGGGPTLLPQPLSPFARVGVDAEVETYAMSARPFANPGGFHVLRRDMQDAPTIYNRDSYTELALLEHPDWPKIVSTAGVGAGPQLEQALREHVFLRGPERWSDHHTEDVPPDIMDAKPK